MNTNKFYVYGHYTADTNELFYIGKGSERRAWCLRGRKNPKWNRIVKKHGIQVKILEDNLTENDAFRREKELIKEVGIEKLSNITEGGDGLTSTSAKKMHADVVYKKKFYRSVRSKKHREKMSRILKKAYENPDVRQGAKDRGKRNSQNPEWRRKISEVGKRNSQNPEWRRKISEVGKRNSQNPKWRRKISDSIITLQNNDEYRKAYLEGIKKRSSSDTWKSGLKKRSENPNYKKSRKNCNSKVWGDVISPEGVMYKNIYNLTEFCYTHNLNYYQIRKVCKGQKTDYKGWKKYEKCEKNEN